MFCENSGEGNCMYYAYGISLMYFLRKKNNPDMTEDIFNTLELKEEEKIHLRTLLLKDSDREFSYSEIKNTIEPILGRATRNLASEYTKREFQFSPQDTSLFSSAHYGLEFCFRCSLKRNGSELFHLIPHEFDHPDYISAEIYRVDEMDRKMTEYSLARAPGVINEFDRQWKIKELEWIEQKIERSEEEIQSQKTALLDNILRNETVNFFSEEDGKHLQEYVDHLRREKLWGSEETLFVLHRAIQGEHFVRNPGNQEDRTNVEYDRAITLRLYRDGIISYEQAEDAEMVLNNEGNVHWTSFIPESIFVPNFISKESNLYQLLDYMQIEYEKMPQNPEKKMTMSGEWINTLKNQLDIMSNNTNKEAKEKAIEDSMALLGKMIPILANYTNWKTLLIQFFSALVDCTPLLMAENKINSDLPSSESLMPTRQRAKITCKNYTRSTFSPLQSDVSTIKDELDGLEDKTVSKLSRNIFDEGIQNASFSGESDEDYIEHVAKIF